MTISFLPASYGDCIHISDNDHHVIIMEKINTRTLYYDYNAFVQ